MIAAIQPHILAWNSPIQLQYLSWFAAIPTYLVLAAIVVLLGIRSLAGLGPVRKWVAIGTRLLVLLLLLLILAGVRFTRQHKDLEVIVLADVSGSIENITDYPGAADAK